ncbi:MAG: flagellar motor protein MotB [Lachnospiraceae bacterium]|nr:flagellar motor protein MotB [Lachnospiraceae bacterium]
MAKKKQEEAPKGSPAWMATFSDLMNLLLCFFVLLFSMSSIDVEKYELVVQSFQEAFSILPSSSGSTVVDGKLVSSGISQLPEFANYFGDSLSEGQGSAQSNPDAGGTEGTGTDQTDSVLNRNESIEEMIAKAEEAAKAAGEAQGKAEAMEDYEQKQLAESEQMAENIQALATQYGIQDQIQVDFTGQYVRITLNGSLLFDSGSAELVTEALPLVQNISMILDNYTANLIEIEGHTDNIPIKSSKYEDNDVLSMYRALHVANLIRSYSQNINPGYIESTGRGQYSPVADNSTAEGRARNRRVEVKIYNSYNSESVTGHVVATE